MRANVTILAFLMVVLPTAVAGAQGAPVPDRGAELALRTGLAIPFGETQGGPNSMNLDQYASSAIPFVLEAGFRVDSNLFLGARFGYAFANVKNPNNACSNGASCDGSVVTMGIEGIYRLMPEERFAPWVGLGVGYDWTTYDVSAQNVDAGISGTLSGFQGLVMAGGDVRVNEHLVLGPALEASFGRFDSAETRTRLGNGVVTTDSDIDDTAWHTWFTIGIRGAFGL